MKRKIVLFLFTTLLLSSCGAKNYEVNNNQSLEETKIIEQEAVDIQQSDELKDSENNSKELNYEVDIILPAYSFDGSGIESYVEQLKKENPNEKFSVYNDEYYINTITEKERIDFINNFKNGNELETAISDFISDEQYGNAILEIKYDEGLQNFELYVDKELYSQNEFVCSFGSSMFISMISNNYQAYQLIKPEERITNIIIIDNETGNVID